MDSGLAMFVLLFWTGPIGLGVFLAGLGVFYWGRAKLDETGEAD